jgi:hypothetical protein
MLPACWTEAEEVEPVGIPVFGLFPVMVPWALDSVVSVFNLGPGVVVLGLTPVVAGACCAGGLAGRWVAGGVGALRTGGGALYAVFFDCAGKNSGINIAANSIIATLARWLETRMSFMVAPSLSRVSLCALAGNSISHFSVADAEGNAVGVPLRPTKRESNASKVKFHIP